jgi:hypothetical protein
MRLLQFPHNMADWKQITARIRRARGSKDPAGQLSNLYQKTRDAMVAFELARHFETAGQGAEAAKWYSTAAERFRRSDWKTKAQEAAARLGGQTGELESAAESGGPPPVPPPVSVPEPAAPFEQNAMTFESLVTSPEAAPGTTSVDQTTEGGKRRRRGRRGGRNRRRTTGTRETVSGVHRTETVPAPVDEVPEARFSRVSESISATRLPSEAVSESGAAVARGRYGDPGLSSRLTFLEMQFRRLLTCAPLTLEQADSAPAGPGVFLLSDSDLTTHYYVEACQTLRIAVANLLRSGASRRGGDSIKPKLAEHLGIAESRVSKYLADHCVVRYLQLDDDASHFAHFVIAVLRPTLND